MLEALQTWVLENWWAVALILIASYVVLRFGDMALSTIVKRTIKHRAHGDISTADIKKRQDTIISLLSTLMHVLVWLVAAFSIVERLFPAIDLTPIIASAGVLGVALGFGAQTIIKDFLSGVFIILENQYRVGDVVQVDGATGTVEQITIRSTILRDQEGGVHHIPNGQVLHSINKTMGFATINLPLSVAVDADLEQVSGIIDEVGTKMAQETKWKDKIMVPPHFTSIGNFNDTSIELEITGKTQPSDQWDVIAELRKRLLAAFRKQKVIITNTPTATAAGVKKK